MDKPYKRKEVIGDAVLYLGDCLQVMPTLGKVDAVVTDPPYGVRGGRSGLRKIQACKTNYETDLFDDTTEYIKKVCVNAVEKCIEISNHMAITTGYRNMYEYPKPNHAGIFHYPASCTMSCWGVMLWQPILYYGKDPHQGKLLHDSLSNCNDSDRETKHPCPKPLKSWSWLVKRASLEGHIVLDPFMGSGTTGVACANLGRKFIGIELEPKYFDIACKRIYQAQRQGKLFTPPKPKPEQGSLI